jgi:hypothetical protein
MKKKIFVCSLLFILALISASYLDKYSIADNQEQIEKGLLQFMNRPQVVTTNIDILEELDLDNKKYVFFLNYDGLGEAELTKGLNNKYKIESVGYGGNFFEKDILKTDKSKYLIIKGKNPNQSIAYIMVLLDYKEYKINLPQEEYYIVYNEIPQESSFVEINNIKLFDKNNVDITREMF